MTHPKEQGEPISQTGSIPDSFDTLPYSTPHAEGDYWRLKDQTAQPLDGSWLPILPEYYGKSTDELFSSRKDPEVKHDIELIRRTK